MSSVMPTSSLTFFVTIKVNRFIFTIIKMNLGYYKNNSMPLRLSLFRAEMTTFNCELKLLNS